MSSGCASLSDTDPFHSAIERMKLRVLEKMTEVVNGKPLHHAAAELGLMPFEFEAIYQKATELRP